jgi:hypothetical protein
VVGGLNGPYYFAVTPSTGQITVKADLKSDLTRLNYEVGITVHQGG